MGVEYNLLSIYQEPDTVALLTCVTTSLNLNTTT